MGNSNEMARAMAAGLHAPQFASMAQAAQGLVGGINAGVAQVDKRNKDMQRYEANQYVSSLLGEATPENYEANLMKAAAMSPYASPELMKQADTARAMFQRKEDKSYQANRDIIGDAFKTGEFIQRGDQFEKTLAQTERLAKERNALQLELTKMQEAGANERNLRSTAAQLAGINKQIKAQENQMLRLDKQAEIASAKANTEYVRKMLGEIDVNAGVKSHASTLAFWQPQDTSRVSEYGMNAKNLLLRNAGSMTPDQARYFKGLFETGRFGQAVAELKAAGLK